MCFFSKFTCPFCALRIRYIFFLQTGKNIAAHSWAAKTERVSLELFVRGAPTAARAAPVVRSSLSGEVTALPGHLFLTWPMIPEPPCRMIDNLGTSCEPFVNPKIGHTQRRPARRNQAGRRIKPVVGWTVRSSRQWPHPPFSSLVRPPGPYVPVAAVCPGYESAPTARWSPWAGHSCGLPG